MSRIISKYVLTNKFSSEYPYKVMIPKKSIVLAIQMDVNINKPVIWVMHELASENNLEERYFHTLKTREAFNLKTTDKYIGTIQSKTEWHVFEIQ